MNPQVQVALEAAGESALMAWGARQQMIKACEEAAELIQSLTKRLNGNPYATDEVVIDEIADVTIMATQMRTLFGGDKVDARILYKLERTMNRIRAQADPHPDQMELPGVKK